MKFENLYGVTKANKTLLLSISKVLFGFKVWGTVACMNMIL